MHTVGVARYVDVQESVLIRWEGVCSVGECTLGVKFFKLIIKIDQSEMIKSHMFNA